jgi:large subunit ribosomal protein L3
MSIRSILGKKIGTTAVFTEDGKSDCVTAIQVGPCTVTQVKTADSDGYDGAQIGFENIPRANKPTSGHLKKSGSLFRYLKEVEVSDVSLVEVGQEFDVGMFDLGDKIDATGFSKGRGFAGGVKRWGFKGGPKTHGQSDRHRAPGSIGAGSSPGRVIKGLKMAGHMGNAKVTAQNLEVVLADKERNLLLVKGSVPGSGNSLVLISKKGV